jgi:penicillin-binding protein 1A
MVRWFGIGFLGSLILLLAGLVGIHVWYGDELPSLAKVRTVESSVRTEIYDRSGALIATLSLEDRRLIGLHDVSPTLVDAILAIEDRRFYEHWGVDPIGLIRATLHNLTASGGPLQGGSTITQQLAWNLFLTHEQTVERKLKELVMTLRLERSFSKDEILELYMNEIYFGDGAYGVETAARRFFSKGAAELTVAEAAVLAGIPKNPARYSPVRHPERALGRRNVVLRALRDTGAIDEPTYQSALAESLIVAARGSGGSSGRQAPYFVETIRQELVGEFGSQVTYEGGLRVYTTLDLDLQHEAERRLEEQIFLLETLNRYDYLADSTATDVARLQGAAVAIDPRSGAVRVMVGGRDFDRTEFNRATQARRQPGSAFKPFIFAAAMERRKRTTDLMLDERIVRFLPSGDRWEPTNFSRTFKGVVTVRDALVRSINIPSVLLLEEVGVDQAIATARRLGISSPLPPVLSLALGTGEVSLLELTSAYSAFANRGIYSAAYVIERVEDQTGKVLTAHEPTTREALDEEVAFLVSDMMRTAVERGTGRTARQMGLTSEAAGKTGTTDDYTDAWFVGYSANLLAGAWVGFDMKIPIGPGMTGATAALPIWTGIMKAAEAVDPPGSFPIPDGVVAVSVCTETARTATPYCTEVVEEYFVRGTEPQLPCTFHEQEREGAPRLGQDAHTVPTGDDQRWR